MTSSSSGGRPATGGHGSRRPSRVNTITPPVRAGRPATPGHITCARCDRNFASVRVRWPDGQICSGCFRAATDTYGTCPTCLQDRMLPGRTQEGKPCCRGCAGISTNLLCDNCGREAE